MADDLEIRCNACGRKRKFNQFILGTCMYCITSDVPYYNFNTVDLGYLRQRARIYKLSVEQFLDMVEERRGACDICHSIKGIKLYIDHCHTTNVIRGLVCNPCNTSLGYVDRILRLGYNTEPKHDIFLEYLKNNRNNRNIPS
jgi:hypothetical protein